MLEKIKDAVERNGGEVTQTANPNVVHCHGFGSNIRAQSAKGEIQVNKYGTCTNVVVSEEPLRYNFAVEFPV